MKNISIFIALLLFISCNNEPKQEVTASNEPTQKTPPPLGLGAVKSEGIVMARAVALAVTPDSTRITPSGDTILYYSDTKTGSVTSTYSYKVPRAEIRAKGSVTPPVDPPTPPTGSSKYLALQIRTTGMTINGQTGTVIENIQFKSITGNPIYVGGGSKNITIRNCYFNKATAEAIVIERGSSVNIENNLFNGVTTGVYALDAQTIVVRNNEFVNVRQRSSGGRGQFVQFNNVSGAGNIIENNRGENFLGESDPEDMISMFQSSGTATSPILIRNNTFRGGGPSTSGGGIILGDYGGRYQVAENNKLLNPGQYGMAIAGGSDCKILNNKIVAKQQPFTNNPLYMWAQQGASCSNNTVAGNIIWWIDKNGGFNGGWDAGNCGGSSFTYPTRFTSYAAGESALAIPPHFLQYVNAAELLTIRK